MVVYMVIEQDMLGLCPHTAVFTFSLKSMKMPVNPLYIQYVYWYFALLCSRLISENKILFNTCIRLGLDISI